MSTIFFNKRFLGKVSIPLPSSFTSLRQTGQSNSTDANFRVILPRRIAGRETIYFIYFSLVYTEIILIQLFRNLLVYKNTLESVPETNQY